MKGIIGERNGRLYVYVDVGKDSQGLRKRHWETLPTGASKRDAQRRLRQILTSIETGAYIKPARLTLGQWLEQWLAGYVATSCAPRTQASYAEIVRLHINPAIGGTLLNELEPRAVQELYSAKTSEGKVRTARYCHSILRQSLGHAVKQGLVGRNVVLMCDPPRLERKALTTLAADDIPKFLEAASATPFYPLFLTLFASGMRRGEALALKWKNVDLAGGYAFVVESGVKLNGIFTVKGPKTAAVAGVRLAAAQGQTNRDPPQTGRGGD